MAEHRTSDFTEAAIMTSLGARLERVEGSRPGVAVLSFESVSSEMVRMRLLELIRELELVEPNGPALRKLIDNTFLGSIGGMAGRMKNRALGR